MSFQSMGNEIRCMEYSPCALHMVLLFLQEKHTKICQKSATKRRKVFDSSRQRAEGTDIPTLKPIKPKVGLQLKRGLEIKLIIPRELNLTINGRKTTAQRHTCQSGYSVGRSDEFKLNFTCYPKHCCHSTILYTYGAFTFMIKIAHPPVI